MASFIIKGDCDDACAKLKVTLEQSDAKFNAAMQSRFNTAPQPKPKPVAAAPAAPAYGAKPRASGQAALPSSGASLLSRSGRTDDSVRGRLRTSLRVTPSR